MLLQANTLATLAQIAIALAGFAALAGSLGERRDREAARIGFQLLRFVVFVGVLLLVLALLPLVIAAYGVAETTVWRASSVVAFVMNALAGYVTVRGFRRAGLPIVNWIAWTFTYPLEVVAQVPLLLNIAGAHPQHADAFYLTYLVAALTQAAGIFLRLLDLAFSPAGD